MPEEYENGCLWLWEKTTDYILTEWLLDSLPTLYMQDETIFQYNQWKQDRSKKSCTLFSPVWAVSSLFNVEIPLWAIKERDEESYSKWRMKDSWRLVAFWVDHIVDCWNESEFWKKYWNVAYYSIELKNDELVQKVLAKRYSICTWFQWNRKYTSDKNDWVLDWTSRWSATYWHAIQSIRSVNDCPARIQDNYYWTAKFNIYDVKHKFSEISAFYERWYVLTKVAEDNIEELKRVNEIRTKALRMIEDNSAMRHLVNDEWYKNKLHEMNEANRKKVEDCDIILKRLS